MRSHFDVLRLKSCLLTLPEWYAEQGLCNGRVSVSLFVHPSLRLSVPSIAATAISGFATEYHAGSKRRRPAANAGKVTKKAQHRLVLYDSLLHQINLV